MTYNYADIEFAMCAIRILVIIAVVAGVAFATKSRAVFVAGVLGSLAGYVAPELQHVYVSGTPEMIWMSHLHRESNRILYWGIAGAGTACTAVFWLKWRRRERLLEAMIRADSPNSRPSSSPP